MVEQISFSTDYAVKLCNFCGEGSSELKSAFKCNNGTYIETFYCYTCFFGENVRINISQPFLFSDCSTEKCIDCDSESVHKISGGANNDLYFCDTHINKHAPCI